MEDTERKKFRYDNVCCKAFINFSKNKMTSTNQFPIQLTTIVLRFLEDFIPMLVLATLKAVKSCFRSMIVRVRDPDVTAYVCSVFWDGETGGGSVAVAAFVVVVLSFKVPVVRHHAPMLA